MKDCQVNSFPCKICDEVFTEESGASKNFTCENCETAKILKIYNTQMIKKEITKTIKRHLKGIEKAIKELEKE